MRADFSTCANVFSNFSQHNSIYNYTGPVYGIFAHTERPPIITYEGCKNLCGTGTQYYTWKDVSNTIFTWVFPVISLLLQAPYEGNKNWSTMLALPRWIGNPIAGMSYVFWNIKVTGRCAMILDMATPYNVVPGPNSQFAQIRDSLYLLAVMNQYTVKQRMPIDPAEKLLRIALFSDSLHLTPAKDRTDSLVKKRQELAKFVRAGRKRGVIQVYVSILMFVIALAVSIQAAFTDQLGDNETAHDLAFGLLLGWLPIFIQASITDRNPVATDQIRLQLNELLNLVRSALLDPHSRSAYISAIGRTEDDFTWTKVLETDDYFQSDVFVEFAGQGRVRWHLGCVYSVLSSIENAWIAGYGRDWLHDADGARARMIASNVEPNEQLVWFDLQIFWQIAAATAILYGCAGGAFIISYFTPTFGLGCRSGGYVIYVSLATMIFATEMSLWWVRATFRKTPEWMLRWRRRWPFELLISQLSKQAQRIISLDPKTKSRSRVEKLQRKWATLGFTDCLAVLLRFCEFANAMFLTYIVFAQTLGAYQNCKCMCSTWSPIGGYMDFMTFAYYQANGVKYYWGFGTAISCITMTVGLSYVVNEYCTQSHLSTEDYESAAEGLRTTRRFKKYTMWLRHLASIITNILHFLTFSIFKSRSQSLAWDYMTKDARIWTRKVQILNGRPPRASASASVEDEPSYLKPLAPSDRSFSNNTTLADPDEQHERWYAKALAEEAEGLSSIEMQAPGRAAVYDSPPSPREASRSPLSRSSTLWS